MTTSNDPKTSSAPVESSQPLSVMGAHANNTENVHNNANNNNNSNNLITISNVAEIFHAAGYAFKKLSELIQTMDPTSSNNESSNNVNGNNNSENGYQSHWEQADVDHFSTIVNTFTEDLNQLSMNLRNKMSNRLKEEHSDAKMKTLTQQDQELINNNLPPSTNVT